MRVRRAGGAGDQRYYVSDTRRFQRRDRLGAAGSASATGVRQLCTSGCSNRAEPSRRRGVRAGAGRAMKFALVNPPWTFEGSIYFGCREPHLPLEYGYAKALLEAARPRGRDRRRAARRPRRATRSRPTRRARSGPDFTVVTTAPSYLFWRCAPPELRVPQRDVARSPRRRRARSSRSGRTPRPRRARRCGSWAWTWPSWASAKRCCRELARRLDAGARSIRRYARRTTEARVQGAPHASRHEALPALRWPAESVARHHASPSSLRRRRRRARAPRWRPRAAARITAPSARRTTSATSTASARSRSSSRSSTG